MNNFLLDFLALGAILSGILVITSKNPVISVLFLISVFVNVAGYLVLLGIAFIGISYLIVYIGAIAILFLFVVMMLNLQLTELTSSGKEYTQNLPLGAIVGSLFLYEFVSILPFTHGPGSASFTKFSDLLPQVVLGIINWFNSTFLAVNDSSVTVDIYQTFTNVTPDTEFTNFLQIQSIGFSLYTYGALWLIIASIILLLAMVGPITLSIAKNVAAVGGRLHLISPLFNKIKRMCEYIYSITQNNKKRNKVWGEKYKWPVLLRSATTKHKYA